MPLGPPGSAGQRNLWVTVEEFVAAPTSSGFPGGWWQPVTTLAMSRTAPSGEERFTADQTAASIGGVWTAPYHPEIDPDVVDVPAKRRLSFRGRTLDIQTADWTEYRRKIRLVTQAASKV